MYTSRLEEHVLYVCEVVQIKIKRFFLMGLSGKCTGPGGGVSPVTVQV